MLVEIKTEKDAASVEFFFQLCEEFYIFKMDMENSIDALKINKQNHHMIY